MSQEGKREVKAVSFKMPLETWSKVQAEAAARGVDVSSVLNWIIADYLPRLDRLREQREAATMIARAEGIADAVEDRLRRIGVEGGIEAVSRDLAELLRRLGAVDVARLTRLRPDDGPASKAA